MQVTECEQTQLYFTMLIIWNYWQLTAAVCLKLTCLSQYECSWLSLWTVITNDKLPAALADPGMGQPGGLPPMTESRDRSWLCEAVCLRHRASISFKS